jgi:predicted RNase H-like HicB family nuclease
MRRYVALIRKESRSDYGVEFPDFPGCVTAGSTLDEALAMAEEALEGHVEVMREHSESVPEPGGLDVVLRNPDLAGAVAVLVPLREKKGRAIPIRITLDEHLLADIDQAAARDGMTRSAFLADAARVRISGTLRSSPPTKPSQATDLRYIFELPPGSMNARAIWNDQKSNLAHIRNFTGKDFEKEFRIFLARKGDQFVVVLEPYNGKGEKLILPIDLTPDGKEFLSMIEPSRPENRRSRRGLKRA